MQVLVVEDIGYFVVVVFVVLVWFVGKMFEIVSDSVIGCQLEVLFFVVVGWLIFYL